MLKTWSCFNFIWIVIIFFSLNPCFLHAETEIETETETETETEIEKEKEKEKETGPDVYYQDFEEFITVIKEIQDKYVVEVDLRTLLKSGYTGMLSNLDAYSQFIDAEHLEELRIETGGVFEGLGIEVVIRDGVLTVLTPIVDSPAFRAGVFIGDKIIEIDGESTKNFTIRDAIEELRGVPNSKVTLTVMHEGESDPVDITIVRAKIQIKSTRGTRIVDKESKIGYVAVIGFQDNTTTDLDASIEELEKQGMEALILDLRFNPGGLLNIAVDVTDRFIKKGVIVSTKGRHKSQDHKYKAHKSGTYKNFPLIILVNNGSASASEIVAGAVKDHKRGLLLGTKTFGKGSVQSLIPIENKNTALKLTTAKYYTPSGTLIDEVGIEPDIKVDLTIKEIQELHKYMATANAIDIRTKDQKEPSGDIEDSDDKGRFVDVQLSRAIDVLKGIRVYAKTTGTD